MTRANTSRSCHAGARGLVAALAVACTCASAAPARLVGQPIANQRRAEIAFEKAVDCKARSSNPRLLEGKLGDNPFILLAMNCLFVGGNAEWAALMIGFHDGERFTRAVTFRGVLAVESGLAVKGDRIVYTALVAKPLDARCCPTGKAIVEVDAERMLVVARPIGFTTTFAPVQGRPMK